MLGTLRLAQDAERLPWPILGAIHAERRFISISRWLPEAEGAALRERFEAELARLYAAEDRIEAGASGQG